MKLYLIRAVAYEVGGVYPSVLPEWLKAAGKQLVNSGVTNDDYHSDFNGAVYGEALVAAAAGAPLNVTPMPTKFYTTVRDRFDVKAAEVGLRIFSGSNDLTGKTNTMIVGQQINLRCQLSITNGTFTNLPLGNIQWTGSYYFKLCRRRTKRDYLYEFPDDAFQRYFLLARWRG